MMSSLRKVAFLLFIMCVISQLQPGESVFFKELEVLKSKIQYQETKLQDLEAQLKAKQDRIPLISFTAGFKNDPVPMKYNNGQIVIFDDVYINDGNAYMPHAGMFRAPVSGLYFFTINIYSNSLTTVEFRLFKDGSAIAWLISAKDGGTESIQTVAHLRKDQDVWVIKSYGGDTIRGSQLSTFSGFLLRTDDNFHTQLPLQSGGFTSKKELEVLKSRIQSQETKLQSLEAQSKTQQDNKALISFKAGFSYKPVQVKFSSGQTVIFDDVYLNDGYAYNSRSGRFHAPMSGLYLFTLDVFPTSSEMEFKLVRDGKAVAWLVSRNAGGRASIQTAIHLQKDQEIWIVRTSGGNALRDSQLSTFSGVLL